MFRIIVLTLHSSDARARTRATKIARILAHQLCARFCYIMTDIAPCCTGDGKVIRVNRIFLRERTSEYKRERCRELNR